jgi:molybdate transport system substrate-binding protein
VRRLALVAALALCLSACGDDNGERPRLTVSAAASLKNAFEGYARNFEQARVRFSFAGSDELAAQIRQGVKPDLYAAASTRLPDALFAARLVERPVAFARNRLVIATPAGSGTVRSLDDLARPGVKLAIGAPSVPVGSYTRELLRRLGSRRAARVLANVRSNEPDVVSVAGKVAQGGADAGVVYVTDVAAAGGRLRAIELPRRLRPAVTYAAAVVKGASQRELARAFLDGLLRGGGRAALRRAGFEPPP